ncbi:hypothetical protein Tco_0812289, partial [Tanacetum coccineum]
MTSYSFTNINNLTFTQLLQPTPLRLSCDCSFEEGSVYLKVRSARKPKLCPFRLSTDEKTLMWFSGKDGKHLHLSSVRSIIRGHQTLSVYQDNAIVALKRERIFYSTVREGTLNSARSGYSRSWIGEFGSDSYTLHAYLLANAGNIGRSAISSLNFPPIVAVENI